MVKGKNYKFNIMNMTKPDSLYNQGMKVLCCPLYGKTVWKRNGTNIAYYKNSIPRSQGENYYTLTFTINAEVKSMNIASDYPYKYSDVKRLLKTLCTKENRGKVRSMPLCKTLAGNTCELIVITNFT